MHLTCGYVEPIFEKPKEKLCDLQQKRMSSLDLSNSIAIRLTRFFMRFTGIWITHSPREHFFMELTTTYAISTIVISWQINGTDLWFCRADLQKAIYAACNVLTLLLITIKLGMFAWRREKFVNLIKFCYENFWQVHYDACDVNIMKTCELKCVLFVGLFTLFAWSTVCAYTAYPIVENLGINDSERIHAFPIRFSFIPATTTPYFELIFITEELALIHAGICYFCFDNILCIMNVHTAGQFRILQRKLETTLTAEENNYSGTLKDCIGKHQFLIGFAESLEDMYKFVILAQFIIFSLLICLVSYQAVLAEGELSRRMIFIVHSAGTFTQLFMFTLTCDDLMRESAAVAEAAYRARWYHWLSNPSLRHLGKDLMFVMMRARRPCCLTAGDFFPISLETFTTVRIFSYNKIKPFAAFLLHNHTHVLFKFLISDTDHVNVLFDSVKEWPRERIVAFLNPPNVRKTAFKCKIVE
uniref:Odorant receptor n=1 Tax=Campoletis chlorideae TaxID=219166 RepID=A0A346D3V1_9HYME|nr:odorant receptor [Campoletis chlorideae]